jgi:hypothetical protein
MTGSARRYAVLSEGYAIDELFEAVEESFEELARRTDMLFVYEGPEMLEDTLTHVWVDGASGAATIRLTDDHALATRHVWVDAADEDVAGTVMEVLAERLPVESPEALREQARGEPDPRALIRLALGAGEQLDADALEIVRAALRSTDPDVLEGAITAAALSRSPALAPELRRLTEEAPDEGLRAMAAQALIDTGETP